jgi:carboxypeptidase N regulatory subunit
VLRSQNVNLERIWNPVREQILEIRPQPAGVPGTDAPAQEIRTWMHASQMLLRQISWLHLTDLELTAVPMEIGLCTGLVELMLHDNLLISLPEGLFQNLRELRTLSLCNNELIFLPGKLFSGLNNLQLLALHENQLISLPEGLFQGRERLWLIDLGNNRLVTLPRRIFQGLGCLERLFLNGNQLADLPEELFHGLDRLEQLLLRGNPLRSLPEGISGIVEPMWAEVLSDN